MTPSNPRTQDDSPVTALDLSQLKTTLAELFSRHKSSYDLYQNLAGYIVSLTGAGAVSIGSCQGTTETGVNLVSDQGRNWGGDLLSTLEQGGRRSIERKQVAVARLAEKSGVLLIAVPFQIAHDQFEALSVAIATKDHPPDFFIAICQLVAQSLSLWLMFGKGQRAQDLTSPTDFEQLHAAVSESLATADRKMAGPVLVQKLKDYLQADVVMLAPGLENVGGQSILHSSISGFSETSPQMKLVKQVVAECKQQQRLLTWQLGAQLPESLESLILRDMAVSLFGTKAVCFPYLDRDGSVVGTLIVCWNEGRDDLIAKVRSMNFAERLFSGLVVWIGQSPYTGKLRKSSLGARVRSLIFAAVALGIVALGFLPVSFEIAGNCVLEPRQTRFVVAQFDGVLKKVHKLPGVAIAKGDLLAEFDERAVELEISSLLAQIQKTKKMQDVHTATGKAALAQMANLERRGLEEQLQLYRDRLSKLSIVSPVDGIVISDNMERVEGSPVSRGQGLFEIAPLETMIVEAHIAQEDIGYVVQGAETIMNLDSFPASSWTSTVYSVFPRAELREGRSVFLVESLVNNSDNRLRPGMKGELKIVAGKKSLAWKIFRKPWIYFQKTFLSD